MAGYECFACGQERPVVAITTSLVTGDTIASCQEDLVTSLIGALSAELGVDANKLFDALDRFVKRQAADAAKAAQAAAAAAAAAAADQDPPEPQDHDPGPEVDDEGGMSEYRHLDPDTVVAQ